MTCGTRRIRRARGWPISRVPLFFLPCDDEVADPFAVAFHFPGGGTAEEERAGRAGLHALATERAGFGFAPILVEVGDDMGSRAAPGDILGARALNVPADADAAGAEDAAVVVHAEQRMGGIEAPFRITVFVADVIHALAVGQCLQFAVAV